MAEAVERVTARVLRHPRAARPLARSCLGTVQGGEAAVVADHGERLRIVEEPFLSIVSIRQSRRQLDHGVVSACLASARLELPSRPNALSGNERIACGWIEPHAWLVTGVTPGSLSAGTGLLVTDISDRLAAFRIAGGRAREVIAAGCDPSLVPDGACVRTRFSSLANVVIQGLSETDFRLLIDVSLGQSMAAWLTEAVAPALSD